MSYEQEVLEALWDIPGWPRREIADKRNVRRWIAEFPLDKIDIRKAVKQFDLWCTDNEIGVGQNRNPTSRFDKWLHNAIEWGTAKSDATATPLSAEEQLKLKALKRKADLERMGM